MSAIETLLLASFHLEKLYTYLSFFTFLYSNFPSLTNHANYLERYIHKSVLATDFNLLKNSSRSTKQYFSQQKPLLLLYPAVEFTYVVTGWWNSRNIDNS